jgi:prepilin-type N-terminal cleavage/methylation domain-containing protein
MVSRRGVTLIEVMVVVAIVGILGSVSMVAISDVLRRAQLNADADTIDDRLRRGRMLARLERRCVLVSSSGSRLDITPMVHRGSPPADCEGGVDERIRNLGTTFAAGIRLPQARFFFDRSGGVVVPGGSARDDGGVDLTVTVTAPGVPLRSFIIRVLEGTGAITRFG